MITLTDHAKNRIKQRSILTNDQVLSLIESTSVILQNEVGVQGNKEFRLFYSYPDKGFYVAVVNIECKWVITVLFENYYTHMHKRITDSQKAQAVLDNEAINSSNEFRRYFPDIYKKESSLPPPKHFHVLVYAYDGEKLGNPRTISKLPTRKYDVDPVKLIESGVVQDTWSNITRNDPDDIGMVMVKLGKYGKDTFIFDKCGDKLVQRVR